VLHQTPGSVFIPTAHPRDAGFNVQLRYFHVAFPGTLPDKRDPWQGSGLQKT
jgi:hypothetical protein